MNNKSDFYKKTYSEKIDTSDIKKTRNNNRNNGDYHKVEDIYINSTGVYKVENIENNNKYNNINTSSRNNKDNKKSNIGSKLLFLLCVGGLYAYINNTNPIIIKEIGDNFNKLNLTGIISKGATIENISNLGIDGINKIKEVFKIDDLSNLEDIKDNIDNIGENIAPVFNINGLGIGEDNNNNLDININNDVINKMNDEINKINNTNFIINSVDEIKAIDIDENNKDDEDEKK